MPTTETVPHLVDLTIADARALMSKQSLVLETPVGAQAAAVVAGQTPAAGTPTRPGSKVTVT
jgi:beta-lactam-binding protein with PASTA domain